MRIAIVYFLVILIWGSTWYAIEFQLGVVAPQWSIAYRFLLAAVILFLWIKIKNKPLTLPRSGHFMVFLLGLFLFSSNYLMIYFGTGYLTSGLVAVCFSLMTFLNIVNGRVFHGHPITVQTFIGAVFGLMGLALIFMPEVDKLTFSDDTTLGIGFCLIGTLSASFGNTVASSKRLSSLPLLTVNAWGMLYGSLINIVYALLSGEPMLFDWRFDYIVSMVILSVVGTVLAFVLYLWLMAQIGMTKVAYVAVLLPLVALTVSTLFEGYSWTVEAIAGLGLILIGNIIIIKFKPKAKNKAEAAADIVSETA